MRRLTIAIVALLIAILTVSGVESGATPNPTVPATKAPATVPEPPPVPEEETEEETDPYPYEGWQNWCEPRFEAKQQCRCSAQVQTCAGDLVKHQGEVVFRPCEPDRTGRPTVCSRARGLCMPRWLDRQKQRVQRGNLRVIIDHVCQPPAWWTPDFKCWEFGWKTAKACKRKHWCDPEKLHRFYRAIALRESTWDHQTIHRLDPDRLANMRAWARHRKLGTYEGNPHFADRARWGVGMGWLGQNAPNFVSAWDPMAPPEVLCRRVPAVESSRRRLIRAWKKIAGGLDCLDANGVPYTIERRRNGQERDFVRDTRETPTWYLLHRAVWGGDLCPQHTKRGDFYRRGLERRLAKVELDPHEEVSLEMLGDPIPVEDQHEVAQALTAQMTPLDW
jgi:hypothetical protein